MSWVAAGVEPLPVFKFTKSRKQKSQKSAIFHEFFAIFCDFRVGF